MIIQTLIQSRYHHTTITILIFIFNCLQEFIKRQDKKFSDLLLEIRFYSLSRPQRIIGVPFLPRIIAYNLLQRAISPL